MHYTSIQVQRFGFMLYFLKQWKKDVKRYVTTNALIRIYVK